MTFPATSDDYELRTAAIAELEARRAPPTRTTAAALRCASGRIVTGLNLRFAGYGACAEVVAVAATALEPGDHYVRVVCIGGDEAPWRVFEPCGNCRQMLVELAPNCEVLLENEEELVRIGIGDLLPRPWQKLPPNGCL